MMAAPQNLIAALYSARDSHAPAFVLPEGTSLSSAQALERIKSLAAQLLSLGVLPGDRISLRLAKSMENILLAHACIWVGAIIHPLNTSYTDTEVLALLKDAEPRLLVCDRPDFDRFEVVAKQANTQLITLPLPADDSRSLQAFLPSQDQAAALLYTSGTTGKPKGALITHENLLHSARSLARVWQLTGRDVLLHALPVYHAHGLLTAIDTMLVCGGAVLLLPTFDVSTVLSMMPQCSVFMGVPTHYARLLEDSALDRRSIGNLRLAISGSAPLPSALADLFRQRTGVPIIERYGSTEAAIVTAVPPGTTERTGWVGWPLPDVHIRVRDAEGMLHPRGIGTLETRGPHVFRGYWNQPRATEAAFSEDRWFLTGDIAEIDSQNCVRILGREKDLIISGGLNVYPAEVENALRDVASIADAAVFGVPHRDFGEAVVAAVEVTASQTAFNPDPILSALRGQLAAYKIPKRIVVVDVLPRNAMGKLLKDRLREDHAVIFSNQPTT